MVSLSVRWSALCGVLLATPGGPTSLAPPTGPHASCLAVPGLIRLILLFPPREGPLPAPDACEAGPRPAWLSQTGLVWLRWEFYGPAAEGQVRNGGSEKLVAPTHTHTRTHACARSPAQPSREHARVAAGTGRGLQALVGNGGLTLQGTGHPLIFPHLAICSGHTGPLEKPSSCL